MPEFNPSLGLHSRPTVWGTCLRPPPLPSKHQLPLRLCDPTLPYKAINHRRVLFRCVFLFLVDYMLRPGSAGYPWRSTESL